MSRTRRTGPVEGFWSTVDQWAAGVVETSRAKAWRESRCRLEATSGPYVDVLGDLPPGVRPLRAAVAAQGVALPDTDEVREAVAGVEHRLVTEARRYRWNGPALTPVALEVHTTADEAVVEAWWEDVWAAWPTIRLGRESEATKPPRRATAIAQVSRLLAALGHDPLRRLD